MQAFAYFVRVSLYSLVRDKQSTLTSAVCYVPVSVCRLRAGILSNRSSSFWHRCFPQLDLHCVLRKFGYRATLVYCGQTLGSIKMPLGMEVGLGEDHIVLDGDPAPPPKGASHPRTFLPMSIVAKWLDGSRCHLVGM